VTDKDVTTDRLSVEPGPGAELAEPPVLVIDDARTEAGFLPLTVLLMVPDVSRTGPGSEVRLQVLLRRSPRSETTWKPFLRALGVDLSVEAEGETESVIVAVRTTADDADAARWVLFCFGGSSRSVPSDVVDSRFGVVVALNKQAAGPGIPPWRELPATCSTAWAFGPRTA
jgi:hypothetical protein